MGTSINQNEAMLKKASQADALAAKAANPDVKEDWKRIARNYREIAKVYCSLSRANNPGAEQ